MKPTRNIVATVTAVATVLSLAGCSAPAESETEREAGILGVEACFTNELASEPVTLKTVRDGSGIQWEGTARPGATVCTRTKEGRSLFGEMSYVGDSSAYAFRFMNSRIGYPEATIAIGPATSDLYPEKASGMCQGFEALETGVLDSGSTRFTVQRLTDSDVKRFTVKIQPTQSTLIPSARCSR